MKRVLAVYEVARKDSLANYDELKRVFIAVTGLEGAVVDKQLKERTGLTFNVVGPAQRESILEAGLALQKSGVIKPDVDVKKVGRRSDRQPLRRGDELSRRPGGPATRAALRRPGCLLAWVTESRAVGVLQFKARLCLYVLMSSSAVPAAQSVAPKRSPARFAAPGARPLAAGLARGVLGIRGLCRLVQRPAGAAALRDFQDLRRALEHRRTANPCAGDARSRVRRLLLRRCGGHRPRRHHRLLGADPSSGRSDLAGAALDPFDRLGAAVHSVVRHLRGVEDHPDRGRRVLSGLSRRHGRGDVGRPQDRRGRPRVPPVGLCDGAAHPAACRAAGLRAVAARRAWASAGCSSSPPSFSARRRAWAFC